MILDEWTNRIDSIMRSDAAGTIGFGACLMGHWVSCEWPSDVTVINCTVRGVL